VKTLRIRGWLLIAGCLAVTAAVYWTICLRSRAPASPQAVASAEGEVYEAVVRDMVTPIHGQAHTSQLVFDDAVLTDLETGADMKSCQDSVRKRLRLEGNNTPPFNSLADKAYRIFNGGDDDSLRADTIQDFLEKSCTVGRLSQSFHTDSLKTFIAVGSVHFSDLIVSDGSKSFEQMFPGATGIISFSHVGFDPTLREAIVSVSFVCGGLCGSGYRYVLKKKRGRWEVVSKLMLWVS
jgi:hypothetical protein